MATLHKSITRSLIEGGGLPPGGTKGMPIQYYVRDTKRRYFGIRRNKTSITFCVWKGKRGQPEALGRFPDLTVEEAEKKARALLDEKEQSPRALTLAKATALVVNKLRIKGTRESTLNQYLTVLPVKLAEWWDKPLRRITEDAVLQRHAELSVRAAKGKNVKGQPSRQGGPVMADGTMKMLQTVIVMTAGKRNNPVAVLSDTRSWNNAKKRRKAIPNDDLTHLYQGIGAIPNGLGQDLLKLYLYTGLRNHEGRSLRWDQIDWDRKTITIPADKAKNGHELVIPLTKQVEALLATRQKLNQDAYEDGDPRRDYVFPNARSQSSHGWKPYMDNPTAHCRNASAAATKLRKKGQIVFSPHSLRHTYVTQAERIDIGSTKISYLVNHVSSASMTEHYKHLDVNDVREAAQEIADALDVACGIAKPRRKAKG